MGTDQETVEKSAENTTEAKKNSIRQEYTFAADVKLKECKYCRVMIPEKAKICPNCKTALKNRMFLKTVAAVLILAVVVAGGYCLLTYRGSLPDFAPMAWNGQDSAAAPVVSVNTVEPAEAAAGAQTVEPTEVATTARNAEPGQSPEAEAAGTERFAGIGEMQNEETKSAVDSASIKDEDATVERAVVEDKSIEDDGNNIESKDRVTDKSDTEESDDAEAKEDAEEDEDEEVKDDTKDDTKKDEDTEAKDDTEDKSAVEDKDTTKDEEAGDDNPAIALKDIDEDEAAFRAECEQRKYKSLLRDQEYLETAVLVTEVEVVCQVDGGLFDDNIYYLCRGNENSNACYYIFRDDREEDETLILDGDVITVYGRLFGTCKIPANLLETRPSVPAISMLAFDLLDE